MADGMDDFSRPNDKFKDMGKLADGYQGSWDAAGAMDAAALRIL
jgi:hypothetical protein